VAGRTNKPALLEYKIMEKLTGLAGNICFIAIVLMIRCPSLRPDMSPVVHRVGAAFDLYPKSATVENGLKNNSFYFAPTINQEATTNRKATRKLIHEMSLK